MIAGTCDYDFIDFLPDFGSEYEKIAVMEQDELEVLKKILAKFGLDYQISNLASFNEEGVIVSAFQVAQGILQLPEEEYLDFVYTVVEEVYQVKEYKILTEEN